MYYGFGPEAEGWKSSKKHELKAEFEEIVGRYKGNKFDPYVEESDAGGIWVRRITHLTDFQQKRLIDELEACYEKVMGYKTGIELGQDEQK